MEEQAAKNNPRILVVDDSRLMRVAARKILKDHFETDEAEDGEVAWEKLQGEKHFDVIMSDLSMPNLDGLGLLDKIRSSEDERIKGTPVVIVTGAEDDTAAKEQALERGADDFITKPFDSVQLVARTKAQVRLLKTTQERDEKSAALEKQSSLDALTELLNQRAFSEAGEQNTAFAIRHKADLSIIRLEVLNFNKTFLRHGKAAAEQMIKDVAEILKSHLRKEDTAARTGMAQFGLLLPASSTQGTHSLLERISEEITVLQYEFGNASFNAGISCLESVQDKNWNSLLVDTEEYLAEAKQEGANKVAWNKTISTPSPATEEETTSTDFDFGETLPLEEAFADSQSVENEVETGTALDLETTPDASDSIPEIPSLDLPPLEDLQLVTDEPLTSTANETDTPLAFEEPGEEPHPAALNHSIAATDQPPTTLDLTNITALDSSSGTEPSTIDDPLNVEQAIASIAAANEDTVTPHLNDLVKKILPLLELWDAKNGSTLSVCVNTLRHKVNNP